MVGSLVRVEMLSKGDLPVMQKHKTGGFEVSEWKATQLY